MCLNHVIHFSEAQTQADSSADAPECSSHNERPETKMENIKEKQGTGNATYTVWSSEILNRDKYKGSRILHTIK